MADAAAPSGVVAGGAVSDADWRRLLANSALGLMGDTGSGKSTLIATLAEYTFKRYGRITRYYVADPGGFGDLMMSLIRLGIVEVWRMRTRDNTGAMGLPIGTLAQATQGCWPVERDPLSGDTRPGVALIPPYATQRVLVCPCGADVKWAIREADLTDAACPRCQTVVGMANCKEIATAYKPVGGFERVGCVAFDSVTGMCEWGMTDMDARAGRDELGGEKGNIRTQYSAGEVFGTAGRGGVGFIQNRAAEWLNNAIAIPGLVVPPVLTFRKDRGTDQAGLPVYGPQLAGTAKTAAVPGWLGNCFGVEGPAVTGGTYRIYLSQYALKDGVTNLVKHRAAAGTMPAFVEDPSDATLENKRAYQHFNLGYILELLLKAVEQTNKRADEMFPNAPGLSSGRLEVPQGLALKEGGPQAGQAGGVGTVVVGKLALPAAPVVAKPAAAPAVPVVVPAAPPAGVVIGQPKPQGQAVVGGGPAQTVTVPPATAIVVPPAVAEQMAKAATVPGFVVAKSQAPQGSAPLPPAAAPRSAAPKPPATAPLKK